MTLTSEINQHDQQPMTSSAPVSISLEFVLMALLAAFVLITRLLMLGTPAMTEAEIPAALAAWRSIMPAMPGAEILPDSTTLFWLQRMSMGVLGATEFAARIPTALAGVGVVLSVALFRGLLGRDRAFILMLVLAFSPVLLAASRFSDPVVWSVLFALFGLWGATRFWQSGVAGYAVFTSVMLAALIFLSEPGGFVLALILLGSGGAALMLSTLDAPLNDDLPGDDFLAGVRTRLSIWPLSFSFFVALLVVFCVATGFLLYPDGLSVVGETLRASFSGWRQRPAGAPIFYPMSVAFFYETFLFVLAAIAVIILNATGRITFIERFLMAWVLFGLAATLIYPGATAAHALWLILPLAGLTSHLIVEMFRRIEIREEWWPFPAENTGRGKWLLVIIGFSLFLMSAMHFQIASRGFWLTNGGLAEFASRLNEPAFNAHAVSVIAFLVTTLFIIIGYFLASSLVGTRMPAQAFVIGAFLFVLLTSFGSGWNLVGTRSNDPSEVWFINGTSSQTRALRQTLLELSFRQTQGFPELSVVALAPDDGPVAWLLRDFRNAQFVASVDEASTAQVIIMPSYSLADALDLPSRPSLQLGAIYVGQDFEITRTWRSSWLDGLQTLAWWSSRLDSGVIAPNYRPQALERVVLWVRQDVYDGNLFELSDR